MLPGFGLVVDMKVVWEYLSNFEIILSLYRLSTCLVVHVHNAVHFSLVRRVRPVFLDRVDAWSEFAQRRELFSGELQVWLFLIRETVKLLFGGMCYMRMTIDK